MIDHWDTHLKSKPELMIAIAILGDNGWLISILKVLSSVLPKIKMSLDYFPSSTKITFLTDGILALPLKSRQ